MKKTMSTGDPISSASKIDRSGKHGNRKNRITAFLSYENPWGKSGGIAAVAEMLPGKLAESGVNIKRLSPLHADLETSPDVKILRQNIEFSVTVRFEGKNHEVTVFRMLSSTGSEWFLFGAEGFFKADGGIEGKDPYVYSRETKASRDGEDSLLLRDAVFASAAVPEILNSLEKNAFWIVHAQDWEFALTAFTVKEAVNRGKLRGAAVLLTLHNPFDHIVSRKNIAMLEGGAEFFDENFSAHPESNTILSTMIPLTDGPVSTVSNRFAEELTSDPLQTGHFAGHLKKILLDKGIEGIPNGLFGKVPSVHFSFFSAKKEAGKDGYRSLIELKLQNRKRMLKRLESYIADNKVRCFGSLDGIDGKPLSLLPDHIPIFMMVGRLDPGQKGFDILNRLIEIIPGGDRARFILSPLSPNPDDESVRPLMEDLRHVAYLRKGELIVMPFFLQNIYEDLKSGVSWSVWPSLYEPFGGVTEFYMSGTPVVARDTGGLADQVVDINEDPANATGILYRERGTGTQEDLENEWKKIQLAASPLERLESRLYREQLGALAFAVCRAIDIYTGYPEIYGRLLANLPGITNKLSWDVSVEKYLSWYDSATMKWEV